MTKKHFEAAANRVTAMRKDEESNERANIIAFFLADWFATENPAFNRERFLAACNVPTYGSKW